MKIKFKYIDESFNQKSSILEFSDEKEFYHYINLHKYTLLKYKNISSKKTLPKNKDITNFVTSLYFLVKADINILDALVIIEGNFSGKFKENIRKTINFLKIGKNLKESFNFITDDEIFLNTIEIGEESGNISYALKNLKNKYEFQQEMKKEIVNLSLYPLLVLVTSVIIISFLFKFIVPKFSNIYQDLNQEIPVFTKIILKFSAFYERYFFIFIFLLIFIPISIIYTYKTNSHQYEKFFLKLPFIKNLYKEIQILYFSQSMNILLNSGVNILKALELSKYFTASLLQDEIRSLKKKLTYGISFSESIKNSLFFDIEYKNYILIGEETGNLEYMFSHISDIYLIRIKEKVKRFLKVLEPFSIIIIAFFIGLILSSVMFPIFKLGESINI